MHSRDWPEAIARATGYSASWCRQVLRACREANLIPEGRYRPRLTHHHAALVLFGLTAANVMSVAQHARTLEQLPSRIIPTDLASAGDAVADLIGQLMTDAVRPLGLIEINTTWSAVTIHVIDSNTVVSFGSGDHAVHRLVASLTAMPLASVIGVAQVLTAA